MTFDYSKLNSREFEKLGASIIEKIIGQRVETFKAGQDGGIDGRFWLGNQEGILQCKNYIQTPYNDLINSLKNNESKKVEKLKPKKYIFITSKELSPQNKKEIMNIFSPYIRNELDIWGKDDLDNFLSRKENQDIVEQNYKLWITSTSVLDTLLNNAIKGRSESTLDEIKDKAYKYVITENHNKALKILEKNNTIIITGEPGIGKSTLANNLAMQYVANGYEFCDIKDSISEAEALFRPGEKKKILFYYDDFLGSNIYDAVTNRKDSHIVSFIKRVNKDKTKRFILTSRVNILNKAYVSSHQFQNTNITKNEFLLTIDDLSKVDKAYILYNHLFHTSLDKDYIDKIYENKKYHKIITHRNFNPRLIEFITDKDKLLSVPSDKYWKYIEDTLENPKDIWEDFFFNQISEPERILTRLITFNNGVISEKELKEAYERYIEDNDVRSSDNSDISFNSVCRLVVKSLLNKNRLYNGKYEYSLFNPSIADFIIANYSDQPSEIKKLLLALKTEKSLRFLSSLHSNKKISDNHFKNISQALLDRLLKEKMELSDWDYLIMLFYMQIFDLKEGAIGEFIKIIESKDNAKGDNLYELLVVLEESEDHILINNPKFIFGFLNNEIDDEETVVKLVNFIKINKVQDKDVLKKTKKLMTDFFVSKITDNTNLEEYIHVDIEKGDDDEPVYYTSRDDDGIKNELNTVYAEIIEPMNKEILETIGINKDEVIELIDISNAEDLAIENADPSNDYDPGRYIESNYYSDKEIDLIFER